MLSKLLSWFKRKPKVETRTITDEEIEAILQTLQDVYHKHGKHIETVTLYREDLESGEMLVDNRDKTKLN